MQVILLEKMPNLGQLGDVVRVKDGYARNFLIPYGKAKRATESAIAEFQARRAELEKAAAEKLAAAQALGAKLSETTVQLSEKAAVDGRLFGSVTNHDIAAALNASGLKVEKAQVRMPNGALKIAGEHTVTVALHPDVVVDVKVVVAGEAA
ncbi:MAG: 50S ribosomal protein L9 [Limnobacter sp.]|jgi:large subunit ribosomal protein L9|uniref:Large ribosomal subunit protein bL9 n=1 Tax=Limnobacter profundi TaxID=2732163 RepID=A0ABX6N4L3_9BURK|nr:MULTISPECIES: 50S ribosomal protein L9 [unclassified Limnobacter]MAG80118.1 50S ribosomal protein L9 [Sutterellaceae bacterium]MBA4315154.1 50S ribosomal protein L9 [Alcaligenaceae bacterium]MBU0540951.1 50S ribosomal protein L9 [Gammaproteobacteria bacterium]PZO13194.1 MAG: 50S ribosomal protein L9 [Betaproteobacteria bacterium]KYP10528.1 MAG: 50S ribosomal protein L9 [Limnobacter sp. CACIAM 66H1]|tara:strand:- start:9686 stop:10138 length:453 start_codon:yes stop_codon:yes gene_type:complete